MGQKMDSKENDVDGEQGEAHINLPLSQKRRGLRTVAAFLMFFGLGLTSAVHGPTLVNLKELLSTDMVHLSLAMSMLSIGYLLGAILCGVLFHRLDSELQFSVACVLMSVSLMIAPWAQGVYGFVAACFFTGVAMAYIDTGGNAIILMLWCGHRAKDPLLQGLHFIWSVGSTLSPFMLSPFLVNHAMLRNHTHCQLNTSATEPGGNVENVENVQIATEHNASNVYDPARSSAGGDGDAIAGLKTLGSVFDGAGFYQNVSGLEACDEAEEHDITLVRYAYVVVGAFVFVIAALYVAIYCRMGHHLLARVTSGLASPDVLSDNYDLPRCFRFGFFVLVFVFYVLNLILERLGGDYLSLFVVEELGWSVKRGAVVTSAYWGSHACGLLLGVIFSICMPPKLMIILSLSCTSTGYAILLFVDFIPNEAIFAAVMLAGMGVSTIFPSMMLWVSQYLTSTSVLSAVCVTGASLGTIAGYPLVASLIEALGHRWYVYSLLATSLLAFMMIVIIHVYSLAAHRKPQHREEEMGMNK